MLEDFIEFVVKHVVENPEDVRVSCEEKEDRLHYTLFVAGTDLGRAIGKDGRNAKAMRTLLSAASALRGRKSVLEISNEPSKPVPSEESPSESEEESPSESEEESPSESEEESPSESEEESPSESEEESPSESEEESPSESEEESPSESKES